MGAPLLRSDDRILVVLAERARATHGVLQAHDLVAAGVPVSAARARARKGLLEVAGPSTWIVPACRDRWTDLAAALRQHPRAAISHSAAAALAALDGFRVAADKAVPQEVTVPHGVHRPAIDIVHRSRDLARPHLTEIEGLRVTTVARTLVDLGKTSSLDRIELAVEHALRDGHTTVEELRRLAGALSRPGRTGPRQLRAVLDRRPLGAPPTGSPLETVMVQVLRRDGLPQPARQVEVWVGQELVAVADFGWLASGTLVEIDGWSAHTDSTAFRRDRNRQNELVGHFRVLRFTAADLFENPADVARRCRPYAVNQSQDERVVRLTSAA